MVNINFYEKVELTNNFANYYLSHPKEISGTVINLAVDLGWEIRNNLKNLPKENITSHRKMCEQAISKLTEMATSKQ